MLMFLIFALPISDLYIIFVSASSLAKFFLMDLCSPDKSCTGSRIKIFTSPEVTASWLATFVVFGQVELITLEILFALLFWSK